jgi:hypothetical protein
MLVDTLRDQLQEAEIGIQVRDNIEQGLQQTIKDLTSKNELLGNASHIYIYISI